MIFIFCYFYINEIVMKVNPLIKWIGSKRFQSAEIIKYFPNVINTYYEPFCGSCSVMFQLLNSREHTINNVVCSDINGDLIDFWKTFKKDPKGIYKEYVKMWTIMSNLSDDNLRRKYFESIRDEFNQTRSPYLFFFLMRTCTNGVPRYNHYGQFNNTLHLTRDGINPKRLEKIINQWSNVLNEHNVEFRRCDYSEIFGIVEEDDFLYLDPPYELTRSTGKFFGKIDHLDLFDRIRLINENEIRYALSFDGGDNTPDYVIVPPDCYVTQINICAKNGGYRKTQQRLDTTIFESLYIN